jgi:hypothetical protein
LRLGDVKLTKDKVADKNRQTSFNLNGNWLLEIETKIKQVTGESKANLQKTRGRINSETARSGASYFIGNCFCLNCKKIRLIVLIQYVCLKSHQMNHFLLLF